MTVTDMKRSIWRSAGMALCIIGSLTVTAATTGRAAEAQPGDHPGLFAARGTAGAAALADVPRLTLDPALTEFLATMRDDEAQPGGRPWRLAQSSSAPAGTKAAPPAGGAPAASAHGSLAEVGAKLSDPTSNVWALFTEFDIIFSDGDLNLGDPLVGFSMLFQPILPVPLFGKWKVIVRPTIPIIFRQPVPQAFDDFDNKLGLGDSFLPLLVSPPSGNWILGLGPTFTFPTSTVDQLGRQQWAVGPTAVLGYKTKKITLGVFPQYFFGVADRGDRPDGVRTASNMSLLYFFFYNLPDAWQVGFAPSITFDDKAMNADNKWNVPVGPMVTKTLKIGTRPVKIQVAAEYSVVSQDFFAKRFMFRINIIPVIPGLIKTPLLGGAS